MTAGSADALLTVFSLAREKHDRGSRPRRSARSGVHGGDRARRPGRQLQRRSADPGDRSGRRVGAVGNASCALDFPGRTRVHPGPRPAGVASALTVINAEDTRIDPCPRRVPTSSCVMTWLWPLVGQRLAMSRRARSPAPSAPARCQPAFRSASSFRRTLSGKSTNANWLRENR